MHEGKVFLLHLMVTSWEGWNYEHDMMEKTQALMTEGLALIP